MATKKEGCVEAVYNKVHFWSPAAANAVVLVFNAMKLTVERDDTLEITGVERLPACRSDKPSAK